MFIVGDLAKVVFSAVKVVLVDGFTEVFLMEGFTKVFLSFVSSVLVEGLANVVFVLLGTILSGTFWNVVLDGDQMISCKSVSAC